MNSTAFQNELINALPHMPTTGQHEAIVRLSRYLVGENGKDLFILRGYAGTGKTTLIGALVDVLNSHKQHCILLAPTGRAAKVMSTYSNHPASTIHRRIYWLEEQAGLRSFKRGINRLKDAVFIVDEASMISSYSYEQDGDLLSDLVQFIFQGVGCKLILVGDVAQLPPVGTALSPALIPRTFRDDFQLKVDGAQLKEVVRQEDASGILVNATQLRVDLLMEQFKLGLLTFSDVDSISGTELQESLNESFSVYGEDEVIIITRSNKRANLFNQQIRARMFYRESEIEAGDKLMVVKNNYHWLGKDSAIGFIANGDMAEVMRVTNRESMYGLEFADVELRLLDYLNEGPIGVKIMLDAIDAEGSALSKDKMDLLYQAVRSDFPDSETKAEQRDRLQNDPYLQALQVKFAYAVTCHKAQGGQWDAVFIDQGYLTEELIDLSLMRWMYTAITRAKKRLFLVNFNADFIGKGD